MHITEHTSKTTKPDFSIESSDGHKFYVSKYILSSHSAIFNEHFALETKESAPQTYKIEYPRDIVRTWLKTLYAVNNTILIDIVPRTNLKSYIMLCHNFKMKRQLAAGIDRIPHVNIEGNEDLYELIDEPYLPNYIKQLLLRYLFDGKFIDALQTMPKEKIIVYATELNKSWTNSVKSFERTWGRKNNTLQMLLWTPNKRQKL